MSLRSELKTLEAALAITSPVAMTTTTAFEGVPGRSVASGSEPAVFTNTPYAPREVGQMGSFQELIETVEVRFTAYDADFDRAVEIADAFKAVFINAIAYQRTAGRRLNGTFDYVEMRDSNEPVRSFDGRPGWECALDFTVFRTVVAPS